MHVAPARSLHWTILAKTGFSLAVLSQIGLQSLPDTWSRAVWRHVMLFFFALEYMTTNSICKLDLFASIKLQKGWVKYRMSTEPVSNHFLGELSL